MEDSTFMVHTPLPNSPLELKKPAKEPGENPKCLRSLLSESNKRASPLLSDIQPLALAFPEDPNSETESEGATLGSSRAGNNGAAESKNKQALVCVDAESCGGREEKRGSGEGFPPRMVAMHRLRWNTNKGSERWLCYGGAAGILRCQEIALPLTSTRRQH